MCGASYYGRVTRELYIAQTREIGRACKARANAREKLCAGVVNRGIAARGVGKKGTRERDRGGKTGERDEGVHVSGI